MEGFCNLTILELKLSPQVFQALKKVVQVIVLKLSLACGVFIARVLQDKIVVIKFMKL